MSIVKINAITVPADSGDELGRRFAARGDSMAGVPGFEGFELLRPSDGRTQWLVLTRWADEESFAAWTSSQHFARSHGGGSAEGDGGRPRPVGTASELWSYTVALSR
ncbi:antibiotic biosynthesis monooxygenase [Kocuria sp. LUK]|uniref:Antibiotic biosynthesis monooxygenase n=1 Tax=Kocuria flava TaxID=446860 RepID=A0A2N4T295_9MICC|nr:MULTISPECIES: antibiotic biosynthesis monooxygenase family protein [Kocuria]MCD1145842.1 antibiotic biosynthesis monooxygenase [Kocuria sp. LUK]PLC12351.1 antibiotic biosynthesis monooxygenase [Kocuria flava]